MKANGSPDNYCDKASVLLEFTKRFCLDVSPEALLFGSTPSGCADPKVLPREDTEAHEFDGPDRARQVGQQLKGRYFPP